MKKTRRYVMNGEQLDKIKMEKDLGIIIIDKLKTADQVVEARKKALRMLEAIYRNSFIYLFHIFGLSTTTVAILSPESIGYK